MTSRPRLLAVPCLLALAAGVLAAVALFGDPVDGLLEVALIPTAGLLLVAAGWSYWTLRGLASDLDRATASANLRSALLDDVFAAKAVTVLVATDELGAITRFNPGAEAVVGVSRSLALGRSPSFFLDETEIASLALAMRTEQNFAAVAAGLVSSDQQQPIEWPFRRPDGERRTLAMTISPIQAAGEEVTGYLCAGRDVTDEEGGDSGTEQFLATMSLELRAPMASILGYAEMLQEEMGDLTVNAGVRNFVDRIERNGQRMLLLIQDLLTLTRVEDPDLELNRDEIDLRALVSSAYDDLRVRTYGRQLDLSLRLPPDPVLQDCDPKLVEQVVTQLLVNASEIHPGRWPHRGLAEVERGGQSHRGRRHRSRHLPDRPRTAVHPVLPKPRTRGPAGAGVGPGVGDRGRGRRCPPRHRECRDRAGTRFDLRGRASRATVPG